MGRFSSFFVLIFCFVFCIYFRAYASDVGEACGAAASQLAEQKVVEDLRTVFVIDTNIIYNYPDVLLALDRPENRVVLPMAAIKELDRHKTFDDRRSQDSRAFSRKIRQLIDEAQQKKATSITLPGGAELSFDLVSKDFSWSDYNLDSSEADDHILAVALTLKKNIKGRLIVLSEDNNVVIRAFSSQLEIANPESVLKGQIARVNKDTLPEPVVVKVSADRLEYLRTTPKIEASEFSKLGIPEDAELFDNQYIIFEIEEDPSFDLQKNLSLVWRYRSINGEVFLKHANKKRILAQTILPRSNEQIIAMDLLLDPSIKLVNLIGKAGTGKTLLALAAAMTQGSFFNIPHGYQKVIIVRPNQESGKSMGFLPGNLDEKLDPYLAAFRDQLAKWIESFQEKNGSGVKGSREFPSVGEMVEEAVDKATHGSRSRKTKGKRKRPAPVKKFEVAVTFNDLLNLNPEHLAERLIESGQVRAEALAYIRGRTLRESIVIVDETQNLKFEEVVLLATRLGENSKIVFLGDPRQRDTRELSAHNNGLIVMAQKMKGVSIAGSAVLVKSERSPIAEIIANLE